jgi:hypothetical protein
MRRFARRTALVALVWLTAASTLLAGLPHFDCVCPDGQRKPVCFGVPDRDTGCCCGGCCCASKGQSAEGAVRAKGRDGCCCCCQKGEGTPPEGSRPTPKGTGASPGHEGQAAKGKAGKALRVDRPRCARTLIHADDVTSSLDKAAAKGVAPLEPLALPVAHPTANCPPATPPLRDAWSPSHAPPPTDLVITLLHLVI